MLAGTQDKADEAGPAVSSSVDRKKWLIELSLLFLIALLLRCAFNFFLPHVNNFAACDAFEYINNGQALMQICGQPLSFWQNCISCLSGAASPEVWHSVKSALEPMKDFYISGPVYPAVMALNIWTFGGTVGNVHAAWPALLFGNSVVSALTCVFIAMIAKESFGKMEARFAGIISALYPAFIVNSGRLYSETFACLLLVALSYITIRGFRSGGNNFFLVFLSGFLAASLQLTRSVMSVLSLALFPITALQQKGKKRILFVLPFIIGFALVALPWLGFQKLAFGGGGLVVDRVGHYNFFIGNNIDTQGWLSYPYPDGRNVEAESFPKLLQTAFKKSPSRWFKLMLDKPLRLFKYPWNDFRTAIGVIDFKWQVAFHEFVLLFSLIGLSLSTFLTSSVKPSTREFFGRLYLAGLYAFHCIYFLFITVPRYNLTSIPEMIIFAAAALALCTKMALAPSTRKKGLYLSLSAIALFLLLRINLVPCFASFNVDTAWMIEAALRVALLATLIISMLLTTKVTQGYKRLSIVTCSLITILILPLIAVPLRANGHYQEWYQDLKNDTPAITQTILLPVANADKPIYLLIDSAAVKQTTDGLSVSINGTSLNGPVLPSMAFAEDFDRFLELGNNSVQREGERMWDSLTNSADCGNLDLRQWSMLAIPSSIVQDAAKKAAAEKSPDIQFNVCILNKSKTPMRFFGSYDQNSSERIIPSLNLYSWEKVFYGVENSEGLTDTRYDIKVPAHTLQPRKDDLSSNAGLQNGVYNMSLLIIPPSADAFRQSTANQGLASVHYDQLCKTLAEFKVGDCSANTAVGKNIPIDIQKAPFITDEGPDAKAKLLDPSCESPDAVWLLRVHGNSRIVSGDACPAVEIVATYKRKDGSTYTYKSAWVPRRLRASKDFAKFEFVVPVKPLVQGASICGATLNVKITTPDSPYLNTQRQPNGTAEFQALGLDIIELPSNPIGLGHQVF